MAASRERIDWVDAREANRLNWDDRVPLHEAAYALGAFDDTRHMSAVVRSDLFVMERFLPGGSLAGLDLCHLQCHIGTDTISLARAGARVTGVDLSPSALAVANRLAEKHGIDAQWVLADVLEARRAVTGDFDVVYTSIGTIMWLDDLTRWAAQIAALLRPGGVFYFRDGHPMLFCIDAEAPELVLRYPYFPDGRALAWDDASTYAGEGSVEHARTYEWPHSVSEVVSALLAAGLRIELFEEGQVLPWQFSPKMVAFEDGYAWPEEWRQIVPCTLTLVARRPG